MHNTLGRPQLMLVDLRPVNRPMVLVTSHDIAEQVSKSSKLFPTSVPKADLRYLEHLIGSTSVLASYGEEWKALRRRFNPGFAPQHLMTLLPCILEKTSKFIEHLDTFARTGRAVVMDVDLEAQFLEPSGQGELVRLFRELLDAYTDDKADYPWWIIPHIELKRRRLGKRIDVLLKEIIHQKHAEKQSISRSILSLSLQGTKVLSSDLVDVTSDQLKTFLLAGHDTTSVMLGWVLYELSRTPRALDAVHKELDSLLGTEADPEAVYARLLSPDGPDVVRRMSYVSSVIKEVLRLHPPAATARTSKPGTCFTVRTETGEEHCLDGTIIYNCNSIIHRDPSVYGESADSFVPERWLGGAEDGLSEKPSVDEAADVPDSRKVPAGAWRPFERGPRACIGQEFATIEARVIIAVVARRYDFTKVGLGEITRDKENQPILDGYGQYKVKSHLYNTRQVTAKPVDGMKVKVKMTGRR
ncbi:putative cytochrome p450 protein [Eutypa lata UCREL1]|uniref:Putative cytochrome p450 protein n=1 Tax=Eutypa lata (strain UCR-EL1) TaxID=1287681 RepID=M7T4Z7_EUTLA|nr:putative cytochrome p450 protein [Eutypa lata UCREL1]